MEPSLMPASAGNLHWKPQSWKFLAWTTFFLVNLLIGYVCSLAGIDLIHQIQNVTRDRYDLDWSDLLIKFSVIYLVSRHQLVLRTWSDSTPGLALAWIVSIMLNLIVGDLLTGLVWRSGGRLLSIGCLRLSEHLMRNYQPTYILLGVSSWLRLMAASQIKYALAYYLLYRSVRSLLQDAVAVETVVAPPHPSILQNDQLTYMPMPVIGRRERSARSRTRSRAGSRRR